MAFLLLLCTAAAAVYTKSSALIGGPSWLRLHQAVIVAPPNAAPVLFDFLPLEPTAPATAAALIGGRAVPGRIRQIDLPRSSLEGEGAVLRGETTLSLDELRRWVSSYPCELALYGHDRESNHCRTFTARFVEFATAARGPSAAPR